MTRRLQAWARLGGPSGTRPAGCMDAVGLCVCIQRLYHMCMHMRMRNITVDMQGRRLGRVQRDPRLRGRYTLDSVPASGLGGS